VSVRVDASITVSAEPATYRSHPSIARSPTGEWLLVFSNSGDPAEDWIHPPNDQRFVNLLTRSSDEGRSWSTPIAVPDDSWTGVECSGITALRDGTILLNQFRFDWRLIEEARQRSGDGSFQPFILDPANKRWRRVLTEADWGLHPLPYARGDHGSYVHRSVDDGHTWETTRLEIGPYQGAFSPKGATELPDGEVVLAIGSHEHDPLAAIALVRSRDGGTSWTRPIEVACVPGLVFSEPTVVAADPGRLLVFSREETSGFVYQSVSDDGGHRWLPPVRLPIRGYPTHAVRLQDGRIVIVYGVRRQPFAIRASMTEDGGRTWADEMTIQQDLIDSRDGLNLGYPSLIEYRPGKLFIAYYAEDGGGTVGIRGVFASLD
jgi:sialidase-1